MPQKKSNKTTKNAEFGQPQLADPFPLKWPVITSENELKISNQLERIFDKYESCLQTIKKPPKWKKQDDTSEPAGELGVEDRQRRDIFKSWFVTGMNSVMKNLEKDRLRLVLMCKSTQPSLMKKAILHLINQHSCPGVCVSDLLQCLQKSWPGLSSATVVGVLKADQSNDFDVLVEEVDSAFLEAGLDRNKMFVDMPGVSKLNTHESDSPNDEVRNVTETKVKSENNPKVTPSVPPTVDGSKYYIYKTETSEVNNFSGESFIAFGADEDIDTDVVYKTVNGKRDNTKDVKRSNSTFGIRPSLTISNEIPDSRKRSSGASYKYDHKKARGHQNDSMMEERKYRKINMKKRMKNADKKSGKQNKKKGLKNK